MFKKNSNWPLAIGKLSCNFTRFVYSLQSHDNASGNRVFRCFPTKNWNIAFSLGVTGVKIQLLGIPNELNSILTLIFVPDSLRN